ncbi:MAG: hypothetical protein ACR2QH_18390 [Geminicoccaceae bacterium]
MEGIASIEAEAYKKLETLGGPAFRSVRTVGGGGAVNEAWTPDNSEAAFGAARLARLPFLNNGNLT